MADLTPTAEMAEAASRGLRQLRFDHRPQRQLLPLPQLWQQHGL